MEKDVCVTYVNDEETDFVYLSDQLKVFYPDILLSGKTFAKKIN